MIPDSSAWERVQPTNIAAVSGPYPGREDPSRNRPRPQPGRYVRVWIVVRYPVVGSEADLSIVLSPGSPLCTSKLKLVPLDKTIPIGGVGPHGKRVEWWGRPPLRLLRTLRVI